MARWSDLRMARSLSVFQNLPQFGGEHLDGEGFHEQRCAGRETGFVGDSAGNEDDLYAWPRVAQSDGQLGSRQVGHENVSDQNVDASGVSLRHVQRFLAVAGAENAVAQLRKQVDEYMAQRLLILHQEDGFHAKLLLQGRKIFRREATTGSLDERLREIVIAFPGNFNIKLSSPHPATVLAHHGLAGLAAEGLLKLRHIYHQAVDPVLARRVWIGDGAYTQILRTLVLTGPLRVADEEPLVGRKAVAFIQMLIFGSGFPRCVRQDQPAQVCDVLALGELAVDLDVVDDDVLGILIDHALAALLELLGIVLAPPVAQITLGVELAALVVEAVGEFVTNRASGIAVVRSIVQLGIIERRLQHAGREIDIVHLRVVIGVDGRRRHAPLAPVQRPADLRQLAFALKNYRALHVAEVIVAPDFYGAVVAPLVGITDLVYHRVQFLERLLLGFRPHPGNFLDVIFHRLLDPAGHLQRVLFGIGGESAVDKLLAQGFTQEVIDLAHATLPARRQLLHTAQRAAIELEVLLNKWTGEIRGVGAGDMPAQVGLDVVQAVVLELPVEFLVELGLGYVESVYVGNANSLEIDVPIEARCQRLQALAVHLVKEIVGIPLLHPRERCFRQRRFHPHNGLRFMPGCVSRIAQQLQHVLHMDEILLPNLFGFRFRLGVVVAIGQAQASVGGKGNHLAGIGEVLVGAEIEKQAAGHVGEMFASQQRRQLLFGLDRGDLLEQWLEGRGSEFLHGRLIHARGKVVANLLLRRRAPV